MKSTHILLLGLAITASGGIATTHAKPIYTKVAGFSIEDCHKSFEQVNFCSKPFIAQYRKALTTKQVNFNHQYILHFLKSSKERYREVVAINPHNKQV